MKTSCSSEIYKTTITEVMNNYLMVSTYFFGSLSEKVTLV